MTMFWAWCTIHDRIQASNICNVLLVSLRSFSCKWMIRCDSTIIDINRYLKKGIRRFILYMSLSYTVVSKRSLSRGQRLFGVNTGRHEKMVHLKSHTQKLYSSCIQFLQTWRKFTNVCKMSTEVKWDWKWIYIKICKSL